MEFWALWTEFLADCMVYFSSEFGISEAVSIILLTLILRAILLPFSYNTAYNGYKTKSLLRKLKPELDEIKDKYKDKPNEVIHRTIALHKKNNIRVFPKATVFNIVLQSTFGIGAFQAIKNIGLNSRFLWIANIAKPDLLLALLVGILTFFSMSLMPGAAEQNMTLFFTMAALISIIVLISFSSGLGLYWATSNFVTILQQCFLRLVVSKEARAESALKS